MVNTLVSESSGLGSSPYQGNCVVFLGKTLYSSVSLNLYQPNMNTKCLVEKLQSFSSYFDEWSSTEPTKKNCFSIMNKSNLYHPNQSKLLTPIENGETYQNNPLSPCDESPLSFQHLPGLHRNLLRQMLLGRKGS